MPRDDYLTNHSGKGYDTRICIFDKNGETFRKLLVCLLLFWGALVASAVGKASIGAVIASMLRELDISDVALRHDIDFY